MCSSMSRSMSAQLPVQRLDDAADAACGARIGVLQALHSATSHVEQLAAARISAASISRCGRRARVMYLCALLVASQARRRSRAARARRAGRSWPARPSTWQSRAPGAGLTRATAIRRQPAARSTSAALVAAAGLHHHQVHVAALSSAISSSHPRRVVAQPSVDVVAATSRCCLDTSMPAFGTPSRSATLPCWMQVHDWQLFGLHGLDKTGQCVDRALRYELKTLGDNRFGAPTANPGAVRRWTNGPFDLRSNRPACRGQRCALPTAPASPTCPPPATTTDKDTQRRTYKGTWPKGPRKSRSEAAHAARPRLCPQGATR